MVSNRHDGDGSKVRAQDPMVCFVKLLFYFLAFTALDIATTLFGYEVRGLVEANPFLVERDGALSVERLFVLGPVGAPVFTAVAAWLFTGEDGKRSALARSDWAALKRAFLSPGLAADPAARRVQILSALAAGTAVFSFPVFNNLFQILLPSGALGAWRNELIAGLSGLVAIGVALGAVRPLLSWVAPRARGSERMARAGKG